VAFSLFLFSGRYPCDSPNRCGKSLCASCSDYAIVPKGESGVSHLIRCCKNCMIQQSKMDLSKDFDEYSMDKETQKGTILFVHGGGSSRGAWAVLAEKFKSNYRCFAIDLPRSGSRMDQALNYESACIVLKEFIEKNVQGKVIYFGHSLGGYLGIRFISLYPELVSAAVLASCTQHTGPGASYLAKFGLWMMDKMDGMITQKKTLELLYVQAGKDSRIGLDEWDDCFFRLGSFFKHGKEFVQILRESNPASDLPKIKDTIPVLFADGKNDHHGYFDEWIRLSGGHGKLYDSDHFFIMDKCVREQFIQDVDLFLQGRDN
jgi:pimeloyl-ACP methyl ester carboxylesterase